MKFMIHLIK